MTSNRQSIFLYDEKTAPTIDFESLARFAREQLDVPVEAKGEFIETMLAQLPEATRQERVAALARELAAIRVREVGQNRSFSEPLPLEVDVELRRLKAHNRGSVGMAVDGFELQAVLRGLVPREDLRLDCAHIVFTNRLVATWEASDLRYHLRTIILGQPAIISTSGLVEAPAKPREYYIARQALPDDELARAALRREMAGRFLTHDDPRLGEAARGFVLQAAFYLFFGEAFCDDPKCRLYNAHWQEEMLAAQIGEGAGLCAEHKQMVEG